jgi:hypothetical protein
MQKSKRPSQSFIKRAVYEDEAIHRRFQGLNTCLILVAVYIISTVCFTFACFTLASVNIKPTLDGMGGFAAFVISVFLGGFVLGPLTTIIFAMDIAYSRRKSSKVKHKNDKLDG